MALAPAALASAWAYKPELGDNARLAGLLALPAAAGSVIGATLLLAASEGVFETVVPWLVLGATLLIVTKDVLWQRAAEAGPPSRWRHALVAFGLFSLAVYGGYFGAGMGIVLLALLALLQPMNIHQMNAIKNVVVSAINGTAAIYFLVRGAGDLPAAAAMTLGSLAGGFGGAALARKVNPDIVRWVVVAIGVALSAVLAYRRWG